MLSPSLSQAAGKEVANRRASIHWDEESLNDDAHWRQEQEQEQGNERMRTRTRPPSPRTPTPVPASVRGTPVADTDRPGLDLGFLAKIPLAYVVSPRARGGAEGEDAGGGAIGDGRARSSSHSPVASHANSTSPLSAISGYRQTR
eukprot:Tamp_26160.p1 GENE.Tamp_26160~~Tamp_26160.p1  ORF type:complete len:145 (-),score=9.52 Tamp_26160:298-732(-)